MADILINKVNTTDTQSATTQKTETKIDTNLQKTKLCSIFKAAVATAKNQDFNNLAKFDTNGDGNLDINEMQTAIEQIKQDNAKTIKKDKYKGVQKGVVNTDEQKEAFNTLSNNGHYNWIGRKGDNQQATRTKQVENNQRDAAAASRIMLHSLNSNDLKKLTEDAETAIKNAEKEAKNTEELNAKNQEIQNKDIKIQNQEEEIAKLKAELATLKAPKTETPATATTGNTETQKVENPEATTNTTAENDKNTQLKAKKEETVKQKTELDTPKADEKSYKYFKADAKEIVDKNTGSNPAEKWMLANNYQQKIQKAIFDINDQNEKSNTIAAILDYASEGAGTNEPAFKAAIYSLNKENYNAVDDILRQNGTAYKERELRPGIMDLIKAEWSGGDKEELLQRCRDLQK